MLILFWNNLIDLISSRYTLKNTSLRIWCLALLRLAPFCRLTPRAIQGLGALRSPFAFDYLAPVSRNFSKKKKKIRLGHGCKNVLDVSHVWCGYSIQNKVSILSRHWVSWHFCLDCQPQSNPNFHRGKAQIPVIHLLLHQYFHVCIVIYQAFHIRQHLLLLPPSLPQTLFFASSLSN